MWRVTAVLLLIGIVSLRAEDQRWYAAESRAVRVMSDASPAAASRTLAEIESAEAMFRSLGATTDMLQPVRAFAVKNESALRELAPQFWERRGIRPHSIAYAGPHHGFLALREDLPPAERTQALLHEYVHLLTAARVPDAPAWLDEGLAEFWGSLVVEGDRIIVGRAIPRHLSRLQRWQSLERTLRLRRGEFIADSEPASLFYAQSWVMVHYLLLGRSAASSTEFLPSYQALPDDFDAVLKAYVSTRQFREITLTVPARTAPEATASFIPEPRSLAERAQMLVFGPRPDAGLTLARRALMLDPREALAMEVTGTYYFLHNQHDDARAWLARAFDTGGATPAAALYLALLSRSTSDRERYLSAAIAMQPDHDIAWQRLIDLYREDGRLNRLRGWCRWSPLTTIALPAVPLCGVTP